jgi:hypothetical protein
MHTLKAFAGNLLSTKPSIAMFRTDEISHQSNISTFGQMYPNLVNYSRRMETIMQIFRTPLRSELESAQSQ